MLEASRQGYWQADAKTIAELKVRWRDLSRRFDVKTDNTAFNKFVAQGFGLDFAPQGATAKAQAKGLTEPQPVAPPAKPPVRGQQLQKVETPAPPVMIASALLGLLVIAAAVFAGLWRQYQHNKICQQGVVSK